MRARGLSGLLIGAWALTGVLVALRLTHPGDPLGAAVYLVGIAMATLLALAGTLLALPGRRLVPAFLTAGLAVSWLADLIETPTFSDPSRPDLSLADPVHIAGYALFVVALSLITLMHRDGRLRPDVEGVIDVLTIAVVSLLLAWVIAMRAIVLDGSEPVLTRAVHATYPVADAAVLAMTLRAIARRKTRQILGLPFAAGMLIWLFADLGVVVLGTGDSAIAALDVCWLVAAVLIATSTWRPQVIPAREDLVARPLAATLTLAIVPLLVPPTLLIVEVFVGEPHVTEAIIATSVLATLAFVRTMRLLRSEAATREELVAARDAAIEGSHAKSEFLATMSHEIRTPMNGVIGLTHLLLDSELDTRQRQYAEGVRGAGNALLAVINDILDFSKIEAGHLELEEIDFDLLQVVEQVADLVTEPAHAKDLELLAYCDPGLPLALRGDPARLRQVLLNLTSNAVKFTATGEVVVRAHLDARDPDQPMVRFEVVDTGIGIPEGASSRLFEPFAQAESSTTREFGGTGLGLAICHQLVTAMGGSIGVDSEPGRGSTFWFTVPLTNATDASVTPTMPPAMLTGRRALVIDRHDTHRQILENQLTAWGMSVTAAHDSPDPLRLVTSAVRQAQPYDVAIIDMAMPDLDGLELARRITSAPALSGSVPALLAVGGDVTPEQADAAGITATMTRPVLLSRLQSTLTKVFGGKPPRAADSTPATARRGGLVLVVEDGEDSQLVASGMLEHLGYRLEVAKNGPEAVEAVRSTSFHAVLLDVQMARMDGYATAREIRRSERGHPRVPIIAMTGASSEAVRQRCAAAGIDDHVEKPITLASLEHALGRWVGGR